MNKDSESVAPMLEQRNVERITGLRRYATNPLALGIWKIILNVYFPLWVILNICWIVYVGPKVESDALGFLTIFGEIVNFFVCMFLLIVIMTTAIDDFCITLDGKTKFYAEIIRNRPNNTLQSWDVVCIHMNNYFAENGTMFRFVNGYHCLRIFQHWRNQKESDENTSDYLIQIKEAANKVIAESEESYWKSMYPELEGSSSMAPVNI